MYDNEQEIWFYPVWTQHLPAIKNPSAYEYLYVFVCVWQSMFAVHCCKYAVKQAFPFVWKSSLEHVVSADSPYNHDKLPNTHTDTHAHTDTRRVFTLIDPQHLSCHSALGCALHQASSPVLAARGNQYEPIKRYREPACEPMRRPETSSSFLSLPPPAPLPPLLQCISVEAHCVTTNHLGGRVNSSSRRPPQGSDQLIRSARG